KQILRTLQTKIIDGQKQLGAVRAQIQGHEREKRRNELTLREIDSLSNDVTLYKSVGKMFLQMDHSIVVKDLKKEINESSEQAKVLEKKQKYLERDLDNCTTSLKDIMHHSRG
ncbi:Prefoldin, partial [Dimargaris cristalligena]